MRSALLAALVVVPAMLLAQQPSSAHKSQPPQTVPNPPRETPSAVQRYVKYDSGKNILYLEHVRLIDGSGAPPVEDATIVVMNGRIVEAPGPPGSG